MGKGEASSTTIIPVALTAVDCLFFEDFRTSHDPTPTIIVAVAPIIAAIIVSVIALDEITKMEPAIIERQVPIPNSPLQESAQHKLQWAFVLALT